MADYKKSKSQHSEDVTGSKGLDIDSGTLHVDDDNNRVGVGTTSPSVTLDVIGVISTALAEASLSQGYLQVGVDSGGDPGGELLFHTDDYVGIRCADSGDAPFVVKPSGKVGIGTTSPAGTLHIAGAEGGAATLDIYADEGDDNADKFRLKADTDGTLAIEGYGQGSWSEFMTVSNADGTVSFNDSTVTSVNALAVNTLSSADGDDGITVSGDLTASQGAVINSAATTVLQVSADSDKVAEIGKAHIGYDGASADVATFSHIDRNHNQQYALRQDADGETAINSTGGQPVKIKIASSNKLIMDQNGQVGIGAAYSPSYRLDVKEDSASDYVANFFHDGNDPNRYGIRIQAGGDAGGGTTHYINCFDGNGDQVGHITNTAETFALTEVSDERLKDNIRDTAVGGLDTIDNIKVRDFEMKKNGISKTGFVAQELKEVYAPAVTGTEDDVETYIVSGPTHNDETKEYTPKVTEERPKMMGVASGILIPVLVKAIQELSSKVKELESKLGE